MSNAEDPNVIDQYRLVGCVATGGVSTVWEVIEEGTNRQLAMKLLIPEHNDYAGNKAGLRHETNVGKSLDHPNIIKIERFSSSRDNTYMIMEYFRGVNVKLQIKGELNSIHMRIKRLIEGMCMALQHMHERGWVHRDFKPENVLMNKAGEVRLVDFALSQRVASGLTALLGSRQSTIQGTRTYIAPETIMKQRATPATDQYSLGISLFEVLTGKVPFAGSTPTDLLKKHLSAEPPRPSEFNKNVSREMDDIVLRLIKKKPIQRFKDVQEAFAEIRRIKIFNEEIVDKPLNDQSANDQQKIMDAKLDSRADAAKVEMFRQNPELARQHAANVADRDRKLAASRRPTKSATDAAAAHEERRKGKSPGQGAPQAAPQPAPGPMAPPMPGFPPMGFPGGPMPPGFGGPPMPMPVPFPTAPMPAPFPTAPFPSAPMPMGMPGFPSAPTPAMPPLPGGLPMAGAPPIPGAPGMPVAPAPFPAMPGVQGRAPAMPPGGTAPGLLPPSGPPGSGGMLPQSGLQGGTVMKLPVAGATGPATRPATAPPAAAAAPAPQPPEELDYMTDLPDVL